MKVKYEVRFYICTDNIVLNHSLTSFTSTRFETAQQAWCSRVIMYVIPVVHDACRLSVFCSVGIVTPSEGILNHVACTVTYSHCQDMFMTPSVCCTVK